MNIALTSQDRIAVLTGYMTYFEGIMPDDYRESRNQWAKANADKLNSLGEVYCSGLIMDFESGHRVARELAEFRPDVIVLSPTMASPAGYTWKAIKDFLHVPIVIWNIHGLDTITKEFNSSWIIPNSANVGCMFINNMLRRHGCRASMVTGHVNDNNHVDNLKKKIKALVIAGRFRRARFAVIGEPIEGYENVTTNPVELADKVGPELVSVTQEEFTDAFMSVDNDTVTDLAHTFRSSYNVQIDDGDEYFDSVRLCLALQATVERYQVVGGTFNCRHEFGVKNPKIGIVGCLANSYLTTMGVPFTCTGDTITALAMYLGKRLGGDSYYCELDTIDYKRDMVLCANTGEGDFCQSSDKNRCVIQASGKESGWSARGCCVSYPMPQTEGTAIAFTPRADTKGGYVIICAEGEICGTPDTQLALPNMYFKFNNGPTPDAITRWVLAGATHHTCISSGLHSEALSLIASQLGIEVEII